MNYLAAIQPASRRAFSLWLPDFPGFEQRCASIRDVERRADRAVHEALARLVRGGLKAPEPTPKEALQDAPEYRSAFLVRVEVDEDRVN